MQTNYNLKFVESKSYDPWYNLSLEEQLFNNVKDNEIIFYLWQNDNTVVIGRNQNPWRECKYDKLEMDGGKLARRLSGGGAVFHDLGNLNFTFIMKEDMYNIEKQLKVIINAVKKLGINAEFSGRNDILVEGKKFSGNAFYYDEDKCYHHGTLLVSCNMGTLSNYLKVSEEKIKSKGIESVQSRVINLKDINSHIEVNSLKKVLKESFQQIYDNKITEEILKEGNISELKSLYEKYSSWQWRYGETPNFEISLYNRFVWGDLELNLNLKDGYISDIAIFSDAIDVNLIYDLKNILLGVSFNKISISSKLESIKYKYDKSIIDDIKSWIDNK